MVCLAHLVDVCARLSREDLGKFHVFVFDPTELFHVPRAVAHTALDDRLRALGAKVVALGCTVAACVSRAGLATSTADERDSRCPSAAERIDGALVFDRLDS